MKRIIEQRKLEEIETLAKLHGKAFNAPMKSLGVTPEQREEYDSQAEKLLQRMKQKHKDKQHGERQRTTDKDQRECETIR